MNIFFIKTEGKLLKVGWQEILFIEGMEKGFTKELDHRIVLRENI